MRIVVNHLTRMQKGFMCVAGVDVSTGEHVRPLLRRQMRTSLLAHHGGVFEIGSVVDLGSVCNIGQRPELEDRQFVVENASRQGEMDANGFWQLLTRLAKPRLVEIFSKDLERRGRSSCDH